MKDINIKYWGMNLINLISEVKKEHRLMLGLMVAWSTVTELFSSPEMSTGINQSVPLMVVLSLISFLILLELCWWLLQRFWCRVGLPGMDSMVLQFKDLEAWQKLVFFWASFVALLFAAVGVLAAVV